MGYIILRACRCDVIVLKVHTPIEDIVDGVMDSLYKELEHIFNKFPTYNMQMLLGDFNAGKTF
jgi:hypothetical protein